MYAGGNFSTAGGVAASYVAKWDGSNWSALGSGTSGSVFALAVDGSNNLYVGGTIGSAGDKVSYYIARWLDPASNAAVPVVSADPVDQTVCEGSSAGFSAAASGTPAPTVQWQASPDGGASWNDIAGATTPMLSFTAQAADNGKQFHAVFTNSQGSAASAAAALTVNTAPVVTAQPTNQTVNAGQPATFSAAATGSPAPTVQWQVSTDGGATWNDIAGATSPTLTFTAEAGDNGKQFRALLQQRLRQCGRQCSRTGCHRRRHAAGHHPQCGRHAWQQRLVRERCGSNLERRRR